MTTLVTIRPGVTLEKGAAASFQRAEVAWGKRITTTFTYRSPELQQQMLDQWNSWRAGKGPKPPFYRPISPKLSWHCKGLAIDSNDYQLKGFRALMQEHGWRWVVSDEAWHMQYYPSLDKHAGEPAGGDATPFPTPDTLEVPEMQGQLDYVRASDKKKIRAMVDTSSKFYFEWDDGGDSAFANHISTHWGAGPSVTVAEYIATGLRRYCNGA